MAEHLLRRFGDFSLPVDSTDVSDGQLFSVFDPALDRLISLFRTAINVELGGEVESVTTTSVWRVARTGTTLVESLPVASTLWERPTRSVLRERQLPFPLLAIYRLEATHDEWTLNIERVTQRWGLDWILGPLTAADARRLTGAMNGVKNVIQLVIRDQCHPAFEGGAVQFFRDTGGLSTFKVVTSQHGLADFGEQAEGHEFYALTMQLESTELDEEVDGADPPFEGVSLTLGVGGSDGILPTAIEARTEVPIQSPQVINPGGSQ